MILLIVSALCSIVMGLSNRPPLPDTNPLPYFPTSSSLPPTVSTIQVDTRGSNEEERSEQCIYKRFYYIPEKYNTSFESISLGGWMNKYTPRKYFYSYPYYRNLFRHYSTSYNNYNYRPLHPYYQRRWRRSSGFNYNNNPFYNQPHGAPSSYSRPFSAVSSYSPRSKGWKRNTGGTQTSGTGPSSAIDGNYYLYMEADDYLPGDSVTLYTRRELRGCFCMYFKYHLNVNNFGQHQVSSHTLTIKTQDKVLETYTTPSNKWERGSAHVDTKFPTMIRIIATRGLNNRGDIAIDRIKFKPGQCNFYNSLTGGG